MRSLPATAFVLVTLGCQNQLDLQSTETTFAEVEFSVPNMVCEFSCAPTVEKTLAAQPGVKGVQIDVPSKTAKVTVDAQIFDAQAAIAALVDVQFIDTKLKSESSPPSAETTTASVAQQNQG